VTVSFITRTPLLAASLLVSLFILKCHQFSSEDSNDQLRETNSPKQEYAKLGERVTLHEISVKIKYTYT